MTRGRDQCSGCGDHLPRGGLCSFCVQVPDELAEVEILELELAAAQVRAVANVVWDVVGGRS